MRAHLSHSPSSPADSGVSQHIAAENIALKDALIKAESALAQTQQVNALIAQQIRQPLCAVIGYSELLRKATPAERNALLEKLHEAADAMMQVLADTPALPVSTTPTAQEKPLSLASLAAQMQGFFAHDAQRKGLSLMTECDDAIPEQVYSDSTLLRQVLSTLLHHAIRCTAHGTVILDIKLLRISDYQADIRFLVADSAGGLCEKKLHDALKENPTQQRRFGRAGAELRQMAAAVEAMGGSLVASSREEGGSCLEFTLSLAMHFPIEQPAQAETAQNSHWRHKHILIAEDDPMQREIVRNMALRLGVGTVDTAAEGQSMLEHARNTHYDLIITDCQMPQMDGFAATRALRQHISNSLLPVVGVTADVMKSDTVKCYAAGMDDYYHKPLTLGTLERILQRWLS